MRLYYDFTLHLYRTYVNTVYHVPVRRRKNKYFENIDKYPITQVPGGIIYLYVYTENSEKYFKLLVSHSNQFSNNFLRVEKLFSK